MSAPDSTLARACACAACGLALLSAAVWVVLALTHLDDPGLRDSGLGDYGIYVVVGTGFALSGVFATTHRSGRAVGMLLLSAGLALTLAHAVSITAALIRPGPGPVTAVVTLVMAADTLYFFVIFALPLWLPSGRLPGPWRGGVYAVAVAGWSVLEEYYDTGTSADWYGLPNPYQRGMWGDLAGRADSALGKPVMIVPLAILLVSLTVLLVRRPRATGPHPLRHAALLLPYLLWVGVIFLGYYVGLRGTPARVVYYADAAVWPLTLGYVFARDRSTHPDRSTRRVLAAFVLAVCLIAAYTALALALSRSLPGARTTGALALAGAALTIGLVLRPTGRWALRVVDRFYYGERARPYHVVRDLAERLSRAVGPGDAPRLLSETVVRTLRLPGARVVVHTRAGPRELAVAGDPGPDCVVFPLTYEGASIGHLLVPPRPGDRTLDRQDHGVLRFLADQASPAIASLRLYEDLQASREQLVIAREEARRRLRHDLHDGLGPTLSALRLQVDTARAAVTAGSPAVLPLLDVSEGIGQAIVELRRITDGLSPAALDRLGLPFALRQLAERLGGRSAGRPQIDVIVHPDPLPPLPAAVEVAVYRIGGEALNNVVRHSGAAHALLAVRVAPGAITVEVSDDGCGLPPHRTGGGVGLRSMAERAEELGGSFTAENGPLGVVVRASIPPVGGALTGGSGSIS